jgi:ADP-heptose:LPS heptosyltransferase
MSNSGDILVIKLDGLRSFVRALPALRAIRDHHRGKHITLLTTDRFYKFAQDVPYVDDSETLPDISDSRTLKHLAQTIKKERFARIYDLEGSPVTQRIFQALRPFPPAWAGTAGGAKFRFQPPSNLRAGDWALGVVETAGIASSGDARIPDASWAPTARANAPSMKPEFFNLADPFVILCTGSPKGTDTLEWQAPRFAGLAVRLRNAGVGVGVLSEGESRNTLHAVLDACPEAIDLNVRADYAQVAALATHAKAVIGHRDGGYTHLCAAAGAPTVFFAPNHEDGIANGPRGRSVINLSLGTQGMPPVDYLTRLLSMYARVGEPITRDIIIETESVHL